MKKSLHINYMLASLPAIFKVCGTKMKKECCKKQRLQNLKERVLKKHNLMKKTVVAENVVIQTAPHQ
jgi:hypothetical protein